MLVAEPARSAALLLHDGLPAPDCGTGGEGAFQPASARSANTLCAEAAGALQLGGQQLCTTQHQAR